MFCKALRWPDESTNKESCCDSGQVLLPAILDPPDILKELLFGTHKKSGKFLKDIRRYNTAFQMASTGVELPKQLPVGLSSLILGGRIYHQIGSLMHTPTSTNPNPSFAQIYILDPSAELDVRLNKFSNLDKELLEDIQDMLHLYNHFVKQFRSALKLNPKSVSLTIPTLSSTLSLRAKNDKRYALPTASQIAGLIPNSSNLKSSRQIIVYTHDNKLHYINSKNAAFEPLHFVLLFPHGEEGYHNQIPKQKTEYSKNYKTDRFSNFYVTRMKYTIYRLQLRFQEFPLFHYCRRLFQEWIIEMYLSWENDELEYHMKHQDDYRGIKLNCFQDAFLKGQTNPTNLGQKIYLPKSFYGNVYSL